jgi:hypothetical protein
LYYIINIIIFIIINIFNIIIKKFEKKYYWYWKRTIDLIWRIKLIIIIIIINLGLTSPSRPKKLGAGKGRRTQVAWVWHGADLGPLGLVTLSASRLLGPTFWLKSNGSSIAVRLKTLGSGIYEEPKVFGPSVAGLQLNTLKLGLDKFNIIINIKNIIIIIIKNIIIIIIIIIIMKDIIICIINIIIFIIINIIINKFEKKSY